VHHRNIVFVFELSPLALLRFSLLLRNVWLYEIQQVALGLTENPRRQFMSTLGIKQILQGDLAQRIEVIVIEEQMAAS